MKDGNLISYFRSNLRDIEFQRIETTTGGGIPDINYCGHGTEGWIETKKAKGLSVLFQPYQVPWILRRRSHGGRVFIAVRRITKKDDELWMFDGDHARGLEDQGLEAVPSWKFVGGPSKWDWNKVLLILCGNPLL